MRNSKQDAVNLLLSLVNAIDIAGMQAKRRLAVYDEIGNKVRAGAMVVNSLEGFVEKFCKKFNILSLHTDVVAEVCREDEGYKLSVLRELRDNTQIIVLEMYLKRKEQKNEKIG